ncbi:MAG: CHC2 zinc finger domain-containing protein [Dehalococcoidia bacterium]
MSTLDALRASYQARATDPALSNDDRAVAAAQLARLTRRSFVIAATSGVPKASRWQHVPLADLFEAAGNTITARANGTLVCGHEPMHGSRSGTCLVIWPEPGRWWCSSCRTSGDALGFLMAVHGWTAREAASELIQRYGEPSAPFWRRQHRRSRRVIEV